MKGRLLLVVALTAAGAIAVAESTSMDGANRGSPQLKRPLHLPRIGSGGRCPVSVARRADTLARAFGAAPAVGPGPVYPILFSGRRGAKPIAVLALTPSTRQRVASAPGPPEWVKPGWFVEKVLWISSHHYTGPLLIRGYRLDEPGSLLLQWDPFSPARLALKLRVTTFASNWWSTATSTYVHHVPGCYAYQIDGTSFSIVVVFKAVLLAR